MPEKVLAAKTRLSRIIETAEERGEDAFIPGDWVAVAKIVPSAKARFRLGFLVDQGPPIADANLFAMSNEQADDFVAGRF